MSRTVLGYLCVTCNLRVSFETCLRLWYASQYTKYLIRGVFFFC